MGLFAVIEGKCGNHQQPSGNPLEVRHSSGGQTLAFPCGFLVRRFSVFQLNTVRLATFRFEIALHGRAVGVYSVESTAIGETINTRHAAALNGSRGEPLLEKFKREPNLRVRW